MRKARDLEVVLVRSLGPAGWDGAAGSVLAFLLTVDWLSELSALGAMLLAGV